MGVRVVSQLLYQISFISNYLAISTSYWLLAPGIVQKGRGWVNWIAVFIEKLQSISNVMLSWTEGIRDMPLSSTDQEILWPTNGQKECIDNNMDNMELHFNL